jgi:predicted GTPase
MKYNKMQTALAALIKANVPTLIVGQAGHGKSK